MGVALEHLQLQCDPLVAGSTSSSCPLLDTWTCSTLGQTSVTGVAIFFVHAVARGAAHQCVDRNDDDTSTQHGHSSGQVPRLPSNVALLPESAADYVWHFGISSKSSLSKRRRNITSLPCTRTLAHRHVPSGLFDARVTLLLLPVFRHVPSRLQSGVSVSLELVYCGLSQRTPGRQSRDNDNDNDNDTLREVPHQSNEGLALQARVSGPWPHKKESVWLVELARWQGLQVQTVERQDVVQQYLK